MSFSVAGYELIENLISTEASSAIKEILETHSTNIRHNRGGLRNAEKKIPLINEIAHNSTIINRVNQLLGGKAKLVRAIVFIKTQINNWSVSWHQDKTVAVQKQFEDKNWGPWSEKDGVLHVQPPIEALEKMLTVRIHLDDCDEENGCLKVIPESHKTGLLKQTQIDKVDKSRAIHCTGKEGSALLMRPHILHASNKSVSEKPRRVLHLEYSCYALPEGINWA